MLHLNLCASKMEMVVLAACHLLAAVNLVLSGWAQSLVVLLLLLLAVDFARQTRRILLRRDSSVIGIRFLANQTQLYTRTGVREARLDRIVYRSLPLSVLEFRCLADTTVERTGSFGTGERVRVVIVWDSLTVVEHKALTTYLKYRLPAGSPVR